VDITTIAFVTACSALVSAAAGPLVSVVVSARQIRASVVLNNRERWIEALRDSLAEYVALLLSVAILEETQHGDPMMAVGNDPSLLQLVERVALVKNKILLMVNPIEATHYQLCQPVEDAYRLLVAGKGSREQIRVYTDAITTAGRAVLKSEWARVKRGV